MRTKTDVYGLTHFIREAEAQAFCSQPMVWAGDHDVPLTCLRCIAAMDASLRLQQEILENSNRKSRERRAGR